MSNPYREKVQQYAEQILYRDDKSRLSDDLALLAKDASRLLCEIGSGSGNHIVAQAQRDKTATFIGFELRYKRAFRTIQKAEKLGLSNVYIVGHDAGLISELFPERSLDGIFINFPDPWEKRRFRKHRTLNAQFLDSGTKLLRHGGFISFKSDHQEYFASFLGVVKNDKRYQIEDLTFDLHASEYVASNIVTEFEEMFVHEGKQIGYMKLSKV